LIARHLSRLAVHRQPEPIGQDLLQGPRKLLLGDLSLGGGLSVVLLTDDRSPFSPALADDEAVLRERAVLGPT
jgi:hypothetical protein